MVFTFACCCEIRYIFCTRNIGKHKTCGFSKIIIILLINYVQPFTQHFSHTLRKRIAIANYSRGHNTMLYSLSPCPIATNQIVCFIENTKRNGICWEVAIGKYHSIEGCIFSYVSNHFHDFIEYRKTLFKRHLECATILPIATSVGCSSFYDNALAAYRAWFAYQLIRRLQA